MRSFATRRLDLKEVVERLDLYRGWLARVIPATERI
jgi:hypothetical protein